MKEKVMKNKSQVLAAMHGPERFKILEDGWIHDTFLGLEWGSSSEKVMNFKEALKYCKKEGGRLPEIHELHSLVDFSKCKPSTYEAFKDTKYDDWYWTNTPVVGVSWNGRWCVSFGNGIVGSSFESYGNYVRPVRASQ